MDACMTLDRGIYQLLPEYTPEQREDLKKSIRERGVLVPIEFDADTGAILDGHHRLELFSELIDEGVDLPMFPRIDRRFGSEQEKFDHVITVNVQRRQLTQEQRRDIAVMLSKAPYAYSTRKIGALLGVSNRTIWYDLQDAGELDRIEIENTSVNGTDGTVYPRTQTVFTFTTGEQQIKQAHQTIIAQAQSETETRFTPAEELQAVWQVKKGQLWTILSKSAGGSRHRIMCGDATDRNDVLNVFGDSYAQMYWTDPPYGVKYVGKTQDALTIESDDSNETEMLALLYDLFGAAQLVVEPGSPFYVCHPPGPISYLFLHALRTMKWRTHETLIWVKDVMVLGHSDYHYKHEPILYGWTPGGSGRPGRGSQDGTKWFGSDAEVSVFDIARPKRSEMHPTMKPVELIIKHILNSSGWKDIVYDSCVGSGSTLIAAEQTGRVCFALDVEPTNIAVALQRARDLGLDPQAVA